ncbi:MAG TPA: hypothetical protein VIK39_16915 [Candidatus Angelobacter sp.]
MLRGKHATRTMVLTILITLLCDKTCTGTFVTISVMGIIADCRPSGEGGS